LGRETVIRITEPKSGRLARPIGQRANVSLFVCPPIKPINQAEVDLSDFGGQRLPLPLV
jgi:hypothetical protein